MLPVDDGPLGVPWFAEKACPTTNNHEHLVRHSSRAARAKACPAYPVDASQLLGLDG